MSFILDALKKSEAKRRAQAGPEIGFEASHRPKKKAAFSWASIAVVALVCVVIAGGLTWYWTSGIGSSTPNGSVAGRQDNSDAVQNASAIPSATSPEEEVGPEDGSTASPSDPSPPIFSSTEARPSESDAQAVVEPVAGSSSDTTAQVPSPEVSSEGVLEQTEGSEQGVIPDASKIEEAIAKVSAASDPSAEPIEEQSQEDAADTWRPQVADYLYQWELPLTVRQALPALTLSIHVYATEPADRFVLINGVRHREGADLGNGATLAEIRQEGALVDFRDYRFLLTQ